VVRHENAGRPLTWERGRATACYEEAFLGESEGPGQVSFGMVRWLQALAPAVRLPGLTFQYGAMLLKETFGLVE
jgi:hypothetical protein